MQLVFKIQQLFHLRLHKLGHGNARPFGDHLGDVVFGDFLAQKGFVPAALIGLGESGLLVGKLLLQPGQGAVFQFCGLVEVVAALGLLHLQLHPLNLLLEIGELVDRAFLLLPLGIEGALLFREFCQLPLQPLEPFLACRIRLPTEGEFLHLQLQDLAVDLINLLRFGGDFHLQARRRLIHQVDGFVR